jgi:hypothetical protein
MGADPTTENIYFQGRPLSVVMDASTLAFSQIGTSADWCISEAGDMVRNPMDGLIYAAVHSCMGCTRGALITIDPIISGAQNSFIGGFTIDGREIVYQVWGLTIDSFGRLIADCWEARRLGPPLYSRHGHR